MTPETEAKVLEKLDSLIDDVRDVRRTIGLVEANATLVTEQVASMAKCFSDHEERISALEAGRATQYRHPTPSFTNEVKASVGDSIRAAALIQQPALEAMTKAADGIAKGSLLSRVVTGVVLALAIIAALVLGGRH